MPPKKAKVVTKKKSPRTSEEDDHHLSQIDIQYNPDVIANLLSNLEAQMLQKCSQIEKDTLFHVSSIKQQYHLEMIKLPNMVKQMSMKKFREEYGDSLEAVAKGAMAAKPPLGAAKNSTLGLKENRMSNRDASILQTPSQKGRNFVMQTPSTSRKPREGEEILSTNGSPLGEFTVKKAPKSKQIVPQTPSVYVPLKSGEVIDLDNIDLDTLSADGKADALSQVQSLMSNMQALMARLQQPTV